MNGDHWRRPDAPNRPTRRSLSTASPHRGCGPGSRAGSTGSRRLRVMGGRRRALDGTAGSKRSRSGGACSRARWPVSTTSQHCAGASSRPHDECPPRDPDTKINTCMTEVEAVAERTCRSTSAAYRARRPVAESTKELATRWASVVPRRQISAHRARRVVAELRPGERTPVFALDSRSPKNSRGTCGSPAHCGGPGRESFAVRRAWPSCEGDRLADRVGRDPPRFAVGAAQGPRAPQNLYPIGGLERHLRHRLGDAAVIYRALRQASTVTPVSS